ncbi:MAG TPA: VanZ family protein [Anaerolineales bacterium]|nr:VanZ family protein [Anaerolineales bacterium]
MRLISNHGRTWLRWLPALFFAVLIFIFSATPGATVTKSLDNLTTTMQTVSPADSKKPILSPKIEWLKIGHGIGYFWLGVSVFYALGSRIRNSPAAAALCCFYSLTDELHQSFVPGRSASGPDLLLDSLAALAGILILLGITRRRRSGQEEVR